jgi:electron transport complex protein RnfD
VVVFSGTLHLINPDKYADPLFYLFSGGLMLGAFFMATDMVSSPVTSRGNIIYGIGIGLVVMIIRIFGGLPEGVMFAILFMNAFVPLLNRYTRPKVFGEVKHE